MGEFQCILLQLEIFIECNDAVGRRVGIRKGGCGASRQTFPGFWNYKGTINVMPEQPVSFNKWLVYFRLEESREDKFA